VHRGPRRRPRGETDLHLQRSRARRGCDVVADCLARRHDVVLADVRWPEGAARALAAARAAGVPAVLDGDVAPAATLRELCRCCDYAIFSHPGLSLASGAAAVGEGLRRMQKIAGGMVGVTLGADGFLWLDAGHEQRARPPRVVVVDTLAAGDVFHAAFALAMHALRRTSRRARARRSRGVAAFCPRGISGSSERTLPDSASGLRERATRARSAQAVSLAPRCRRRSAKACGCLDPSCAKS
jgi:sulfofructose kinase